MLQFDNYMVKIDMFDGKYRIEIESATIANCSANWVWRSAGDERDRFNLWFIAKGHGWLNSGGEIFELFPGECFLIRLWEPQSGSHDPKRILVVPFIIFTLVAFYDIFDNLYHFCQDFSCF